MSYTLNQFADDCREALEADPGPDGLEQVRQAVSKACNDHDFVSQHLGPDNNDREKCCTKTLTLGFVF